MTQVGNLTQQLTIQQSTFNNNTGYYGGVIGHYTGSGLYHIDTCTFDSNLVSNPNLMNSHIYWTLGTVWWRFLCQSRIMDGMGFYNSYQ